MAELDSTLRTGFAQSKFAAKANFFKLPVFESGAFESPAFKSLVFKLPAFKLPVFKLHAPSHDLSSRPLVKSWLVHGQIMAKSWPSHGQIMGRLMDNALRHALCSAFYFYQTILSPQQWKTCAAFFCARFYLWLRIWVCK